jgi:membrane protein YqaA with SNARE-associated domain
MWEILGGLLVATAISGIVPVVNAEILVVAAAAALPGIGIPLVAIVSTVGQMAAKTSLFALARWAPTRLPTRARNALARSTEALARREGKVNGVVFTSAATGLPPFYGTSLATGALGIRLSSFLLAGGAGRLLRFSVLACLGRAVGA